MPSYAEKESSIRAGEPIEFVRFTLGEETFRYTTSPQNETLFGEVYENIQIQRTAPSLSPEIAQNKITFTMPRNVVLPAFFLRAAPRQQVFCVIYRKHRGESDLQAISYWQGGLEGITYKGEEAEISCGGLESILQRGGLRYRYQPNCRFFFCDGRCPVPASAVTTEAIIISAAGAQVQAAEFANFPNGYFKFGEITTPELESRFIVEHIGDTLTLIAPFPETPVGKLTKTLAGCDYTSATCKDKYGAFTDNGRDFGGFDTIPVKNLFEKGLG